MLSVKPERKKSYSAIYPELILLPLEKKKETMFL